ncbi:MAG: T9SS type A sorting domain-containing protein, partial [Bacteroidota bacterium]|nr:T9SS type A sorting domain-containing protein [Bacteroidota bacterium]
VYGLLSATSVNSINRNDTGTFLNQNIPNPAMQSTKIEFGVSKPAKVQITLFHMDGTRIKTLFQGNVNDRVTVDFNTSFLPSGMYLYQLVTDHAVLTRSLLVIN